MKAALKATTESHEAMRAVVATLVKKQREDELWEAWRARQFALTWKMSRIVAQTGWSAKRRRWARARVNRTKQQWIQELEKTGGEGGMLGIEIEYEDEMARLRDEAPALEE